MKKSILTFSLIASMVAIGCTKEEINPEPTKAKPIKMMVMPPQAQTHPPVTLK